ncbi:EAL domain-containing protein, partial [Tersicoccus solisilvae]
IPLAEETGLVNSIGQWVLLSVCSQLERWQNQGLEVVPVAINISAKQLQTDIISSIEVALAMHGLSAELLEIELTESAVMQRPLESVEILNQLKALGLSLAVDDFGTGYSSLAYLKRFPLDTLKIDREFVRDITKDPDDAAITNAIIVLAHSLELQVVAEGVETQAQLNFLAAQGCDQAQGFLLGRPMTEGQAEALLSRK